MTTGYEEMNLLQHIKRERTQQRKKQPFRQNVFNIINGLIRLYRLDDSFLKVLDNAVDYLPSKNMEIASTRSKIPFEFPLFSLATEEEYSLAMAIISKVDNPYLKFAQSPEEIFLCQPLYRLNPALSPEQLMHYHFETLILHERAKASNSEVPLKSTR